MRSTTAIHRNDFDTLVIESVHEAFTDVLGEKGRQAVYDALEKRYSIARNQIPERLNEFTLALERISGVTPSKTIGKVIGKRLYSKMGLAFVEEADWSLPDYIRGAKMELRTRPTQELVEWNSTSPRLELAEQTTRSTSRRPRASSATGASCTLFTPRAGDSEGRRASA